jgi:hypothetical protein
MTVPRSDDLQAVNAHSDTHLETFLFRLLESLTLMGIFMIL